MRTVHKYPLGSRPGIYHADMPRGAKPVAFAVQGDMFTVWAVVETEEIDEQRGFCVVGTGHGLESSAAYVGTVHVEPFVWHLFELVP